MSEQIKLTDKYDPKTREKFWQNCEDSFKEIWRDFFREKTLAKFSMRWLLSLAEANHKLFCCCFGSLISVLSRLLSILIGSIAMKAEIAFALSYFSSLSQAEIRRITKKSDDSFFIFDIIEIQL